MNERLGTSVDHERAEAIRETAGLLADYLIAATADDGGLRLVTLNTKHFPMMSGVRPPF